MLLFLWTIWVGLPPTHKIHNLSSRLLSLMFAFIWRAKLKSVFFSKDDWGLLSELSEFSKSTNTFTKLYFFVESRSILPTSLEALITRALLTWPNLWCQKQMHLFWLTRCVGWPCPIMAIARVCLAIVIALSSIVTTMACPGCARSSMKKFQVLFAWEMTFSCCIKFITAWLLWYVILVSQSWPSEIRFESHPRASATLCSSILLLSASGMEMVPIFSVQMTCLVAITKLMLLAFRLLNSFQSLQRWRDAHESGNQVLSAPSFYNFCSLTMKAFPIESGAKGLKLELSSCLFSAPGCAIYSVSLCLFLPLCESFLYDSLFLDCWVVLFSLLFGRKQFLLKCLNL